jgi:hypothetical protein
VFLFTIIMEGGIIIREKGVLDLNLGGEKVRKEREDGRQKAREVFA